MLVQYTAAIIFLLDLALRWGDRTAARATLLWITLEVVGVLVMTVGSDIGGRMVYRIGYRGLGGD